MSKHTHNMHGFDFSSKSSREANFFGAYDNGAYQKSSWTNPSNYAPYSSASDKMTASTSLTDNTNEWDKTKKKNLKLIILVVVGLLLLLTVLISVIVVIAGNGNKEDKEVSTPLTGSIVFNLTFHKDMAIKNSKKFKDTEAWFCKQMETAMISSKKSDNLKNCQVNELSKGSVRVNYTLDIQPQGDQTDKEALESIAEVVIDATDDGKIGDQEIFTNVDVEGIEFEDDSLNNKFVKLSTVKQTTIKVTADVSTESPPAIVTTVDPSKATTKKSSVEVTSKVTTIETTTRLTTKEDTTKVTTQKTISKETTIDATTRLATKEDTTKVTTQKTISKETTIDATTRLTTHEDTSKETKKEHTTKESNEMSTIQPITKDPMPQDTLIWLDGPTPMSGILYVKDPDSDDFGTVCDDKFDIKDANVACRMLGFPSAIDFKNGIGEGKILIDDLECKGQENSIFNCTRADQSNCIHQEDIFLTCAPNYRLSHGDNNYEGYIDFWMDGNWRPLCYSTQTNSYPAVVCLMISSNESSSFETIIDSDSVFGTIPTDNGFIQTNCTNQVSDKCDTTIVQMCDSGNVIGTKCQFPDDVLTTSAPETQPTLPIRLTGSNRESEGQVEIMYQTEWGGVCDSQWSIEDAHVACQQLGWPDAIEANNGSAFGHDSGTVHVDDVNCSGNENGLEFCSHGTLGQATCDSSKEGAGVKCADRVRLSNDEGFDRMGRLEVFHDGSWGTVCDDMFGIEDANVVCRQLGFGDAESVHRFSRFGRGEGRIWLDDVSCTGEEEDIFDCPHVAYGKHDCSHFEDVGITCSMPTTTESTIRLTGDPTHHNKGFLQLHQNGDWQNICDDHITQEVAEVACRDLGFRKVLRLESGVFEGTMSYNHTFNCDGSEKSLSECSTRDIHEVLCHNSEAVWISCQDDVCADNQCSSSSSCIPDDYYNTYSCDCAKNTIGQHCNMTCDKVTVSSECNLRYDLAYTETSQPLKDLENFKQQLNSWIVNVNGIPAGCLETIMNMKCNENYRECDTGEALPLCQDSCLFLEESCVGYVTELDDVIKNCSLNSGYSRSQKCTPIIHGIPEGSLRLAGGNKSSLVGRVELLNDGRWVTICDDGLNDQDATFLCKQFDARSTGTLIKNGYKMFPISWTVIGVEQLSCPEGATKFADCSYSPNQSCSHFEDVHVQCVLP